MPQQQAACASLLLQPGLAFACSHSLAASCLRTFGVPKGGFEWHPEIHAALPHFCTAKGLGRGMSQVMNQSRMVMTNKLQL